MKLHTLAAAIIAATLSVSAQADLAITGDVTVGYFGDKDGNKSLKENGSELNLDASAESKGVTYYAHTEVDFNGSSTGGNSANFEEVRVGMKGGFGRVEIGETDNACDQLDVGGTNDTWLAHSQGGCKGGDANNIVYVGSTGAISYALSHNPESDKEVTALGVQGKFGAVTASLGYETGDGVAADDNNIVLGLSGAVGPMTVGVRANKLGDADTDVGANVLYSAGANTFYGGLGDVSDTDSWSVGYNRAIGANTTFLFEAAEKDGDADTSYGIGLKHAF